VWISVPTQPASPAPPPPEQRAELLTFRDMLGDWVKGLGGSVPHRGYHTGTGEADLQVFAVDGTEIEIILRVVAR